MRNGTRAERMALADSAIPHWISRAVCCCAYSEVRGPGASRAPRPRRFYAAARNERSKAMCSPILSAQSTGAVAGGRVLSIVQSGFI